MARRFLVLGLPKILRATIPNAGIEIYAGLFVMAVTPVIYSQTDPYENSHDHHLMILTQLAQTLVVLCGMVRESVQGNLANWIVTFVIMITLCPMFLVLLVYVYDPSGQMMRRVFLPNKVEDKWEDVKRLLQELARADKEASEAIAIAIAAVESGDVDADATLRICAEIGTSAMDLDNETLRESTAELLGAFGVGTKQADELLDSAGLKLLIWGLKPQVEPTLTKYGLVWEDVLPVLETIDSIDEVRDAVQEPMAHLERAAKRSRLLAKKLAVAYLKPPLSPLLAKQGLEWADVLPALETIDSTDELKAAAADPAAFLERLTSAGGPAAKKLAAVYLKPPLESHLAKQGLEWADVAPMLEEVDSIDELKRAIEYPVAFLHRVAESGCENLGIAISASLHVLEVQPGGQGSKKDVQVGDILSKVGSSELLYDGHTPLDINVASMLSSARARGEPFITIEFNGGAKRADFRIKSRVAAAVVTGCVNAEQAGFSWPGAERETLAKSAPIASQHLDKRLRSTYREYIIDDRDALMGPPAMASRSTSPESKVPVAAGDITLQLEGVDALSRGHRSSKNDDADGVMHDVIEEVAAAY